MDEERIDWRGIATVLGQPIQGFGGVVGEPGPPEVLANAEVRVHGFDLSDQVEVAAPGQHDLAAREELQVTAESTGRAPHTLGNGPKLPGACRVQRDDPISFAQVVPPQNDRLGSYQMWGCHRRLLTLPCSDIVRFGGSPSKCANWAEGGDQPRVPPFA